MRWHMKTCTITIFNEKGGVGKTSLALAMLSYFNNPEMYSKGLLKKAVAIDMDPKQRSLTYATRVKPNHTVYDVLVGDVDINEAVVLLRLRRGFGFGCGGCLFYGGSRPRSREGCGVNEDNISAALLSFFVCPFLILKMTCNLDPHALGKVFSDELRRAVVCLALEEVSIELPGIAVLIPPLNGDCKTGNLPIVSAPRLRISRQIARHTNYIHKFCPFLEIYYFALSSDIYLDGIANNILCFPDHYFRSSV